MKNLICLVICITLSGCAIRTRDIVPASNSRSAFDGAFYDGKIFEINSNPEGYEEYRIFHKGATGFVRQTSVLNSAVKRANEFCKAKNGGNARILSKHLASGLKILGNWPRVELIFVCPPPDGARRAQSAPSSNADGYSEFFRSAVQ